MTGLHVVRVDVHVNGVSFEKEKLEEEAGLENAMLSDAQPPALEEKKEQAEAGGRAEKPQTQNEHRNRRRIKRPPSPSRGSEAGTQVVT